MKHLNALQMNELPAASLGYPYPAALLQPHLLEMKFVYHLIVFIIVLGATFGWQRLVAKWIFSNEEFALVYEIKKEKQVVQKSIDVNKEWNMGFHDGLHNH